MSFLYQGFQYLRSEDPVTAGGVTSISLETAAGADANAPGFWPDGWLEAGTRADQSIRRLVLQSDGKVWIGFRRDRSPTAYLLRAVALSFTLDDLEYRSVGLPALRRAVPDNLPAGGALATFLGIPGRALQQWRWCQLAGSGLAFYTELARRIAADEAIDVRGAVELPNWDPEVFGHWYARFAAGGGGAWAMAADGQPAIAGGVITQDLAATAAAPAAWARVAGSVPTPKSIAIEQATGELTLAFNDGDLLPAVIANSQVDVTITKDGDAATFEIEGPRSLITPTGAIPSQPYTWEPRERIALVDALTGFTAATDTIAVAWRPGPVWRWWSGEGDATFGGQVYEGALTRSGATLMEMEPVEWTVERPDIRAKVRVGMQSDAVRRLWQQRLGTILADIRWTVSEDGGETYRDLGRGIVGRISEPQYDPASGTLVADIESWLSDDNLPVKKWSLEGGKDRAGPQNRFFEYSSELAREGQLLDWPRLR